MADTLELIPTRIPAVQVTEQGRRVWTIRLLGEDGEDIDVSDPNLLGCATPIEGQFADSIANEPSNLQVKLVARDEITGEHTSAPHFVIEGALVGKEDECYEEGASIARFVLEPGATICRGIYEGQVGLFSGDTILYTWPIFLEIEPNLFVSPLKEGVLTVWWVRTAIRDLIASDESLLDEVEFANYEIMHAIRRAVEDYNNALPHINQVFNTSNFPWREPLLDGVTAHLYEAAAKLYLRDNLSYSAGGTSINDKDKYTQYQSLADMHRERYQLWTKATKDAENASRFWGTVG